MGSPTNGCDVIASLPQIQFELQSDDTGVGLNIAKTEVGILAILDLGNPALAATKLGSHLRLGESGGHAGDDELVDQLGLGGKLPHSVRNPAIAMSAKHLVDATIGTSRCGWTAGDGPN
jgi:hypothetical protein